MTTESVKYSRTHIGCFGDGLPRSLPNYYSGTGHSVEVCFNRATQLGNTMFGVQNGGECWLDDSKKNNYDKYGTSDRCKDGVGGKWADSVYKIKGKLFGSSAFTDKFITLAGYN